MDRVDLAGFIDLHVHTAPDIRPRYGDDIEIVRAAAEAGQRAILIKSHWTLTADRAVVAEKVVGGIRVFGGLALNSTVGWLNPRAVEVALQMGAKQIWMPTLDLAAPGGHRRPEPVILDDEGKIRPAVYEILDMAREADVILGTGHLAVPETVALVRLARQRGLHKILVTHPEASFIAMPLASQMEIVDEGVFFERCYNDVTPLDEPGMPLAELADQIRQTGIEHTVLSSDYGQVGHPAPTEGFRAYLAGLLEEGFRRTEIERMAGDNPAHLVGL
ncbi:MAG: hypothetical protein A2Y73_00830 [Chloroflexi bacterium RBG_13_56_8]|nr:MAG: hypothetical protein A2Y73_00830 [Chloroflexi bacterium RBG_13_56_8]